MADRPIRNVAVLEGWRKSSYSTGQGGSCVEVVDGYDGGIRVRDSMVPEGAVLVFSAGGWASFIVAPKQPPHLKSVNTTPLPVIHSLIRVAG